jgi:hypothetical protein
MYQTTISINPPHLSIHLLYQSIVGTNESPAPFDEMVESLCPGADDEGVERALAQQQDLVGEGAAGPVHRHLTRCNNRSPCTR